jgi:hypothetical protein
LLGGLTRIFHNRLVDLLFPPFESRLMGVAPWFVIMQKSKGWRPVPFGKEISKHP